MKTALRDWLVSRRIIVPNHRTAKNCKWTRNIVGLAIFRNFRNSLSTYILTRLATAKNRKWTRKIVGLAIFRNSRKIPNSLSTYIINKTKGWFPLSRKFYVRTGVNLTGFTSVNKIRDDVWTAYVNVKSWKRPYARKIYTIVEFNLNNCKKSQMNAKSRRPCDFCDFSQAHEKSQISQLHANLDISASSAVTVNFD